MKITRAVADDGWVLVVADGADQPDDALLHLDLDVARVDGGMAREELADLLAEEGADRPAVHAPHHLAEQLLEAGVQRAVGQGTERTEQRVEPLPELVAVHRALREGREYGGLDQFTGGNYILRVSTKTGMQHLRRLGPFGRPYGDTRVLARRGEAA